jgi:hypothetical protein
MNWGRRLRVAWYRQREAYHAYLYDLTGDPRHQALASLVHAARRQLEGAWSHPSNRTGRP